MGMALGIVDVAVLILATTASVIIGLFFRGKNNSVEAYLLGGRDMPWWAILGSIVATETSTATVLSVPGFGYGAVGFKFLQLATGFIIGRCLVILFLLPLFFDGKLLSAYEILGKRFGPIAMRGASILFLVTRNLGDGLRLFLAAMVLQMMMGWPLVWSAIAMGLITIAYTYLGGMRSVVWNDCIQFVVYMSGAIASVFVIVHYLPEGWSTLYDFGIANNKFDFIDPQFSLSNANTLWAGIIGGAVLSLGSHGTDQMMVQRYLSAKNLKDAKLAIFFSGIVVFLQFSLFLLIGVLLHCFYSQAGNLIPDGIKNDQVFAYFLVHSFPQNTGLVGLMLAAILAAAMSTLSSSLSASASSVVGDLWLPNCKVLPNDRTQVWVTRLLTVGFGLLQIMIGIWASTFDESVVGNALTIAGFSTGVLLGLFLLANFSKTVTGLSAGIGAIAGLAVMGFIQFGLPQWNVRIAFPWLAVFGTSATVLVGLLSQSLLSLTLNRTSRDV